MMAPMNIQHTNSMAMVRLMNPTVRPAAQNAFVSFAKSNTDAVAEEKPKSFLGTLTSLFTAIWKSFMGFLRPAAFSGWQILPTTAAQPKLDRIA